MVGAGNPNNFEGLQSLGELSEVINSEDVDDSEGPWKKIESGHFSTIEMDTVFPLSDFEKGEIPQSFILGEGGQHYVIDQSEGDSRKVVQDGQRDLYQLVETDGDRHLVLETFSVEGGDDKNKMTNKLLAEIEPSSKDGYGKSKKGLPEVKGVMFIDEKDSGGVEKISIEDAATQQYSRVFIVRDFSNWQVIGDENDDSGEEEFDVVSSPKQGVETRELKLAKKIRDSLNNEVGNNLEDLDRLVRLWLLSAVEYANKIDSDNKISKEELFCILSSDESNIINRIKEVVFVAEDDELVESKEVVSQIKPDNLQELIEILHEEKEDIEI